MSAFSFLLTTNVEVGMEKMKITDLRIINRFREDFGDIEELGKSLERYGQLQPIIVNDDGTLLDGERRVRAAIHVGWTEIGYIKRSETDPVIIREIELEANIKRKEFAWPEEVKGKAEILRLRQERFGVKVRGVGSQEKGGFGNTDLAELLGESIGGVSMDLQLAEALFKFPELSEEKTKSAAFNRWKKLRGEEIRRELASRQQDIPTAPSQRPKTIEEQDPYFKDEPLLPDGTTMEERLKPPPPPPGPPERAIAKRAWKGKGILYNGDSRFVLRDYPTGSVDCIVTDPPFALGMYAEGNTTSGRRLAANAGHMYDDDPRKILDEIDQVMNEASRVLKPDGHAYVFFHMTKYNEVLDILNRHFGNDCVAQVPLVWIKNTPGIGDPNSSYVYAYEPLFFINRGRPLVKPQAFNYVKYDTIPPKEKIHPTEKPPILLRHFIAASCVAGEVVLDPYGGSGSTFIAALTLGCKFVGCEREAPFFEQSAERIEQVVQMIEQRKPGNGDAADSPA